MKITLKKLGWWSAVLGIALSAIALPARSSAQDQDDPPGRVARIGYLQGSVSFLPAGETDWVGAVPNRPMSTGDQLWTDQDSRAEVQLGSATIRLAPNTGFSFLNLDDNTVQIQLTSGMINISVRRLHENEIFEVDTPNQAFSIFQPGRYRVAVNADGGSTEINVRVGEGQATGGGQSYDLHSGQRATLSGTDQLYADVEPIPGFDEFDNWTEGRDHRYDTSRSAQYLSHDVVGYDDLDDHGDWRDDSNYGHVWFPQVAVGWAPYHDGHWAWIPPWGWTWVDDAPWGYAPFHYGRWVSVGGRWGWVAGPVAVQAVYAPALVVFIGGGPGGFGGNVGWFPLGPREVYVPSYHVSEAYVTRVNVSSTTVNVTQVTNIYRTTIVNNTTNITNVTYANRNVQGAVMVVPQHAFVSAQPVAKASVAVSAQQIAAAPLSGRVAVAPTRESVLGAKAATAGRVAAPPAAVASRQVVAKKTPPPPPVPFAKQQQALAAHPGQPLARKEVQTLRPAAAAAAHPMVKVAPPAKPATPNVGHPAAPQNAARPNQPAAPANQPANRPAQPAANERPATPAPAQPSRPAAQPTPAQPTRQPAQTEPARPAPNRPAEPPARNAPPNTRPTPEPAPKPQTPPPAERSQTRTPPPNTRPVPEPAPKPQTPPPAERPQTRTPPPNTRPEPAPAPKPQTPPPAERPQTRTPPPNTRPEPAPAPRPQTPPPAERPQTRTPPPNTRPEPAPAPRPQAAPPAERPQTHQPPPPAAKPAPPPAKPAPKTPEQKKKEEEKKGG